MMARINSRVLAGAAALLSAAALAPAAFAGCSGSMQPAAYERSADGAPQLLRVNYGSQGIVGLWAISLTAGGAQVDWGYSEWHADGTEIMNSGGHSPASGNFCLGVWRQTGPNTYHLKHYPLAYNPLNGQFAAKIVLTEDVTVDQGGDHFTGSFTEDVYPVTGPAQHMAGSITGVRVQPN
jgi:hypothetical protein